MELELKKYSCGSSPMCSLSGSMLNPIQNTWQSSIQAERAKKSDILCRIHQLVVECKVQDVSRDLGGNNRSRYESKSNPSRGNAVVQLCSLSTNCP